MMKRLTRLAACAFACALLAACGGNLAQRLDVIEDPNVEACALLIGVAETAKTRQLTASEREGVRTVLTDASAALAALPPDAPFAELRAYGARSGAEQIIAESAVERVGSVLVRGVSLNGAGELAETARIARYAVQGARALEARGLPPAETRAACLAALDAALAGL
ncbi:hypothetical protein [Euryhalocaulis caribicus]|uniref:hypothetical protein n=1 Tax=Euryhalocaulis caribicus TaxID=1161401 RepID=UPI0012681E36|nr:hypothetical protein [Euryhalocaulis caribicus]